MGGVRESGVSKHRLMWAAQAQPRQSLELGRKTCSCRPEGDFVDGRTRKGESRREMGKNTCSKINTASC